MSSVFVYKREETNFETRFEFSSRENFLPSPVNEKGGWVGEAQRS